VSIVEDAPTLRSVTDRLRSSRRVGESASRRVGESASRRVGSVAWTRRRESGTLASGIKCGLPRDLRVLLSWQRPSLVAPHRRPSLAPMGAASATGVGAPPAREAQDLAGAAGAAAREGPGRAAPRGRELEVAAAPRGGPSDWAVLCSQVRAGAIPSRRLLGQSPAFLPPSCLGRRASIFCRVQPETTNLVSPRVLENR